MGTDYRLPVALDLVNLELRQVEVSTDKVGESLAHYVLQEGDGVLIDRGYTQPKSLVPFIDQGGDVVVRYNAQGMTLTSQDNAMNPLDWPTRLRQQQGQAGAIPVYLCQGTTRIDGTVHAIPLPPTRRLRHAAVLSNAPVKKAVRRARSCSPNIRINQSGLE